MGDTNSSSYQLRSRSREVVDYHYDDKKPGRPLWLLIPGALVALAALAPITLVFLNAFVWSTMEQDRAALLLAILVPFYLCGVFLFSYGYELYDVEKALRDTAIIAFFTLAAFVVFYVLFLVLFKAGSHSSSSKNSSSSSSGSGSSEESHFDLSVGSSHERFGGGGLGPIVINSMPVTNTVTHEVVREVPTIAPAPKPVKCSNCGRYYIPVVNRFICPGCGSPTSDKLIEESGGELTWNPAE